MLWLRLMAANRRLVCGWYSVELADVIQYIFKTMRVRGSWLLTAAVLSVFACGCSKYHRPNAEWLVRQSSVIVRCEVIDAGQGTCRLAEMMKDDGSVALKHRQGDTIHLLRPRSKEDVKYSGNGLIVFIAQVDPSIELFDRRDVSMLFVIDGRIPGLSGMSIEDFRTLVSRPTETGGKK